MYNKVDKVELGAWKKTIYFTRQQRAQPRIARADMVKIWY